MKIFTWIHPFFVFASSSTAYRSRAWLLPGRSILGVRRRQIKQFAKVHRERRCENRIIERTSIETDFREEPKPCDIYSGYRVQRTFICDSVSLCAERLSGYALKKDETSRVL